jgi:hypothetical protein
MFDERRTQEFIHLLGEKGVTRNYVSRAYAREIQVARVFPNRAIDWEAANRAINGVAAALLDAVPRLTPDRLTPAFSLLLT